MKGVGDVDKEMDFFGQNEQGGDHQEAAVMQRLEKYTTAICREPSQGRGEGMPVFKELKKPLWSLNHSPSQIYLSIIHIHNSQDNENNLSVHRQMNGKDIIQP